MKVKVIKSFRDKNTGSILRKGLTIDVTEERFSELTGPHGDFVEVVKEIEKAQSQEESKREAEEAQQQEESKEEKPRDNKRTKNK